MRMLSNLDDNLDGSRTLGLASMRWPELGGETLMRPLKSRCVGLEYPETFSPMLLGSEQLLHPLTLGKSMYQVAFDLVLCPSRLREKEKTRLTGVQSRFSRCNGSVICLPHRFAALTDANLHTCDGGGRSACPYLQKQSLCVSCNRWKSRGNSDG